MDITTEQIVIRLLVITLLAGLVGIEREYHGKPAGLRTNVMVGLGSALMTIASIRMATLFPDILATDPSRIAAQIVSGIGFIGAGAILRPGKGHVVGLTTAATLWVVAGLGIAVGMGLYTEAVIATVLVFFTFFFLTKVVNIVREYAKKFPPKEKYHDAEELLFSDED